MELGFVLGFLNPFHSVPFEGDLFSLAMSLRIGIAEQIIACLGGFRRAKQLDFHFGSCHFPLRMDWSAAAAALSLMSAIPSLVHHFLTSLPSGGRVSPYGLLEAH